MEREKQIGLCDVRSKDLAAQPTIYYRHCLIETYGRNLRIMTRFPRQKIRGHLKCLHVNTFHQHEHVSRAANFVRENDMFVCAISRVSFSEIGNGIYVPMVIRLLCKVYCAK